MRAKLLFPIVSAALVVASSAAGQTPPTGVPEGTQPTAPPRPFVEPKLAFDREVFTYPGEGRRDPFRPLGGDDALGPMFEDLVLRGIVWSPVAANSVVAINDGTKKLYKLRVGERIGNARVTAIEKDRVRFAVTSFGITRQEIMSKAPRKSIQELRAAQQQQQQQAASREADISRLLGQELIRTLQTRTDSTRVTTPPVRRDTSAAPPPRPMNLER
ncbi:MAG: hypothetical protein ACRENP_12120 [Longimicrobiales bacterium]